VTSKWAAASLDGNQFRKNALVGEGKLTRKSKFKGQ
jgi:hypothetical protein